MGSVEMSERELRRVEVLAVGCCGPNDYDSCGGSDGRNETAGSPSGASVRKRRRRRPSPSGSWTAFQSSAGAARTTDGDRLCHGALSGLWADLCEPDASGTPWSRGFEETPLTAGLVGNYVETYDFPDGRFEV